MGFVLAFVGMLMWLLGTPISIVILIVYACKKKPIKNPLIGILFCFLGGFLIASVGLFIGYDGEDSDEEVAEEEQVEKGFYEFFINNFQDYEGKKIETTIIVSSCTNMKNNCYITSESDGKSDFIEAYTKDENNYESGDYVTVRGTFEKGDYEYELHDVEIIEDGQEAKNNWDNAFEEYINYFLENSESPSYDDLMRYPDTYRDKMLVLDLKIKDVEPDGMIFDGDITAELGGEKVFVLDKRELKEPRLRSGDNIIAYAFGGGLATVKVKDGSGLFANTVDKYNVPQINIRYFEIK